MKRNSTEPEQPGRERGPVPEYPEYPEYEDEPPGVILSEMLPHPALVVWGALDLVGVAVLGLVALYLDPAVLERGRLGLAFLWLSLPISALIGLMVTAFSRLNLPAGSGGSAIARWSGGLQCLSLGGWMLLSWGAGAEF